MWRVVERRAGVWCCEVMPSQWFGRVRCDPCRLVGELAECLGLALHCAGVDGLDRVTVWSLDGLAYAVEVSGDVPAAESGGIRAEVV